MSAAVGGFHSWRPEKERRARLIERVSREERDAAEGDVEAWGKSKLPAVKGKLAGGGVGGAGGLGMDDVCPFTLKCRVSGEVSEDRRTVDICGNRGAASEDVTK